MTLIRFKFFFFKKMIYKKQTFNSLIFNDINSKRLKIFFKIRLSIYSLVKTHSFFTPHYTFHKTFHKL